MLILTLSVMLGMPGVLTHSATMMGRAVKHALAISFNDTIGYLTVNIQTDSENNEIVFLDMVDEILDDNWRLLFQIHVNNKDNPSVSDNNLWFVDSYESFWRLLPLTRTYGGHNPVYYLVVLKVPTSENATMLMHQMFSAFFTSTVDNVNILLEENLDEVSFYTFFPYTLSACQSTLPVMTYRLKKNSTEFLETYFPPKTENFHGCSIRIVSRNPTFDRPIKRIRGYLELWGLEVELLNGLAARMNFKPQMIRSAILEKSGVSPNGTAYGPFKMVKERRVEFIIGFYLHAAWRDAVLTTSVSYNSDWVVIGLQRPPYAFRKFSWLLKPFDTTVWICFLLLLLASSACVKLTFENDWFIRYFDIQPNRSKILQVFAVAFGGGVTDLPTKNFLRLCLVIWTVGALLIRATYEGMLFDSYRRMTLTKTPLTIMQLLQQDYTIYLQSLYIPLISTLTGIENIKHEALTVFLKLHKLPEKSAIVAGYAHFYMYYTPPELENLLMEPLFREMACIFLQQHSTLANKMNMIILQMDENGMFLRWQEHHNLMLKINFSPQRAITPEIKPIVLQQHKYIFFLLLGMLLIASIVFVGELIWAKFGKRKWFSIVSGKSKE